MLTDKIMVLVMAVIVLGTIAMTGKALHDLNDGRVHRAVKSMVK